MIFNDMNLNGFALQDAIIVTIVGRNSSFQYDGQSHSVTGYNVASISDPSYTVNDFSFSGSASASGINVGSHPMNLEASQFTNNNPKYRNVQFVINDGFVKVTGKPVTITAVAKSKTYDNDSSTDPELTATVSGLIGSDSVSYSISRAQGQNAGDYIITPSGNATQGNYVVSYVTAKFTINPANVTLTAVSGSKTYNNSSQSITGFTCSVAGLSFNSVSAVGSGVNAGSYPVTFSGVTLDTTKDTTGNYVVHNTVNGVLTINPAQVTLTANSDTKAFTGSSQSVTGFTCNVSGLSFNGVSASGSGTNVGSYSVTFSGVTLDTTKDTTGNYVVHNTSNGTLVISKRSVTVTLTITSMSYTYTGVTRTITYSFSSNYSGYTSSKCTITGGSVSRSSVGATTSSMSAVNNDSNYNVSFVYNNGTLTITPARASDLGLSVTSYVGYADGTDHTITASVAVGGTTIQYRTSTSAPWSNNPPARSEIGTTTVYVQAVNSNYETANATAYIQLTSNVLLSLSSSTRFEIMSQEYYITGEGYCSGEYTVNAGTYWFDYLPPGYYYFNNITTGLYNMFYAPSSGYVTVP